MLAFPVKVQIVNILDFAGHNKSLLVLIKQTTFKVPSKIYWLRISGRQEGPRSLDFNALQGPHGSDLALC